MAWTNSRVKNQFCREGNPEILLYGANLLRIVDDNFGMALICGDRSLDFNLLPRECREVAKLGLIRREDYAGERAVAIIGAEIHETVSAARSENPKQPAGDAPGLTGVRTRIFNVHAT